MVVPRLKTSAKYLFHVHRLRPRLSKNFYKIHLHVRGGGVNMRKIDVENLRDQLMSKIDTGDLKEVEKVERYCDLIDIVQQCREKVNEEGPSVKIINGKQEYVKSHPLLNDIAKFNTQIIALEKSIIFKLKADVAPSASAPVEDKDKRGGLI